MSSKKDPTTDPIAQAILAQEEEYRRRGRRARVFALEYFVAGVPPLEYFQINLMALRDVFARQPKEIGPLDATIDLCFIGLAAYFEAFCKDLFAAVINICPQLLEQLALVRDCSFALSEVLHLIETSNRIGSVLSEHYDFGSARSVNGLFQDLMKISPFSKDEAQSYDEFLADRHLLVHHGGVFTFKYAGQKLPKKVFKDVVHWDSLTISRDELANWIKFFEVIAIKATRAVQRQTLKFASDNGIKLGREKKRALSMLWREKKSDVLIASRTD